MSDITISFRTLSELLQSSAAGDAVRRALGAWLPSSITENFWLSETEGFSTPDGLTITGYLGISGAVELGIPNLELVKLGVGDPSGDFTCVRFVLWVSDGEWVLVLDQPELSLVFSREILQAVVPDDPADDRARLRFNAGLLIDSSNNIRFTPFTVSLARCYLANSPFIVSAEKVRPDFNAASPRILFDALTMEPPADLFDPAVPLPKLTVRDGVIDRNGFSGEVAAEWDLQFQDNRFEYVFVDAQGASQNVEAKLMGLSGGIRRFALRFEHNELTASDISGGLIVPYFDEPVDISVNIASNGPPSVTLVGADADGITLTKEELLALNIKSLYVGQGENNVGQLVVSGGLEPLLMSSNGMQWPKLEVTDLSIDSNGKFSIKEAWLDLKDLATLDLFGFHFELRRIGLGSRAATDANGERLWIDLSGGLRLIEQIPVGLDVEGFRLTWPQNLLEGVTDPDFERIKEAVEKIDVEFDGINLSFGVPDTVEFEGLIRFFKQPTLVGFVGDVALRVPAAGFAAEAGLMVGLSFDPVYPFLYVYFGVELPAGIPLGQSGLALKGALGMFGLNVVPDKDEGQNWYYDWYKRGPIVGAHPTNKWKPQQNALALGVGVTITTADGHVKGTRGLLVLSLPGPFLMIEGRALLLSGLSPNAEPPLRALAVFDGAAGTVQFNIEAEATLIADLFKAYGMLEAFFDFNDLTNWHIYLGQDTPRNRRIRADLLKLDGSFLFNADAYLMIDMIGAGTLRSRMGASIAFEPKVPDIDPARVEFAATLEGDGVVTARPEQFSGDLNLSAHLKLIAFEQSIRLSAHADFLTEGPDPISVGAEVGIEVEPPAPFDPIEGTIEFHWELDPTPSVESPLSEIDITSRFEPARVLRLDDPNATSFQILRNPNDDEEYELWKNEWKRLAEESPIVPLDSKPLLGFKHKMNSELEVPFARHPNGILHHYYAGIFEFTPRLIKIELFQHLKKEGEEWDGKVWKRIASTDDIGLPLPGVWLTEFDTESHDEPSPRRLRLWTDNPLTASGRALGGSAEQLSYSFPAFMECAYTLPKQVCVDFESVDNVVIEPGEFWEFEDLRFESRGWAQVREIIETDSSARPGRLIAVLIRIIEFIQRLLARTLRRWFPDWRLVGRLINTVRRLESYLRNLIRNPVLARHHCLVVGGELTIHFRHRVKEARVFLCRKSKYKDEEFHAGLTARRGIRTPVEFAEATADVGRRPTLDEIRRCEIPVDFNLVIDGLELFLQSETGFDCLHFAGMGGYSIRKICYTTLEEFERSERAQEECDNDPEEPITNLLPDAYYCLDITTRVSGGFDPGVLPEGFIGDIALKAYELFEDYLTANIDFQRRIKESCFFKTAGPPPNLRPYLKWSHPAHQAERFFYRDDITLRFLRSNLKTMYASPFDIKIQITDSQGKLVTGFETSWGSARTATQFAEERLWEERRVELSWPERAVPPDDMLMARQSNDSPGLLPSSRYQLDVVRISDVVSPILPVAKSKALFSCSFVTSAFPSFAALVSGHRTRSVAAASEYRHAIPLLEQAMQSNRAVARARLDWEHAQIDFRLDELKGGKQALEAARLATREANAVHDENFRSLATGLADIYFEPLSERLEVCGVLDRVSKRLVCIWIRSPESLDVRLPVYGDTEDTVNTIVDRVGRTEIRLRNRIAPAQNLALELLPSADGTQVLLFPTSNTWAPDSYSLRLTYHRDYNDEQRSIDHRFDRPVEYRDGRAASRSYRLRCVWK